VVALMALAMVMLYGCFDGGGGITPTPGGNKAPIASFSCNMVEGNKYLWDFDASSSSDSDGTILSWEWTFGDGDSANGEIVRHRFGLIGDYVVTLKVIDNDGAITTTSKTLHITGCIPDAEFIVSPSIINVTGDSDPINETVSVDGRRSYDCDGEDDICWAVWDFGDGSAPVSGIWTRTSDDSDGNPQTFSVMRETTHTYTSIPGAVYLPGQTEPETLHYTITLTLTDKQGHTDVTTKDVDFYVDTPMIDGLR